MATHAYQSLEPGGQIVTSDGPREDLEALARWVSIPVPEKAPKLSAAEKKAADTVAAAEAQAKADAEAAAAAGAEGTPPAK